MPEESGHPSGSCTDYSWWCCFDASQESQQDSASAAAQH